MKQSKENFGVFVYTMGGENEMVRNDYFDKKNDAIKKAVYLLTELNKWNMSNRNRSFYDDWFIEVWAKDKDGLWGNSGIPVWCTRNSGYFDRVVKS